MKLRFAMEVIVSSLLILILILFLTPTQLTMPKSLEMLLLVVLIVGFLLFAGLIWKEKAIDEREDFHRLAAGWLSFLAGSAVLVIGIVVQGLQHEIDPWLIYVLSVMILTKIFSRIFHEIRH